MAIQTDVLVVGAGPGGYPAAIKAARLGKKVLLVDKDKLGGECLNYGCIPSKALIHAADKVAKARKNQDLGAGPFSLDWSKVIAWKTQMIGGFHKGIATLEKGAGAQVMAGEVKFTGKNEARVGTEHVTFQSAIICTGSRPIQIPGFSFDGVNVLSSKEALDLTEPPKTLAVIGGGVIGLEIGTFFAKLGTKVTVVEFMPQVLPGVEADLIVPVTRNLAKLGVEVLLQAKAKSWEPGSLKVETQDGPKTIACEKILLSVGRSPASKGFGLETIGVKLDAKGHIIVNEHLQSSVPNIYAAGDVVGAPYLAHKATREGVMAAEHAATGKTHLQPGSVPGAIFTDPEISMVGEMEGQLKARGADYLVGKFPFAALGRAQAQRDPDGFVKVLADKETHRILGAAIVGPSASDLIGEACLAVSIGATCEDVAAAIHPHPTLNEAFQEAAEACLGEAIHLVQPALAAR